MVPYPQRRELTIDLWEVVYVDIGSVRGYKIWVRKPKVSTCFELVRNGELEVEDAREAVKMWGLEDDKMVQKRLNFVGRLAAHEKRRNQIDTTTSDENDDPEISIMMSLLKGLELQILPGASVGSNATSNENIERILQSLFRKGMNAGDTAGDEQGPINFEEILDLLERNETEPISMDKLDIKNTADAIELLYLNDPVAAAKLLAPLLEAVENVKQYRSRNSTGSEEGKIAANVS